MGHSFAILKMKIIKSGLFYCSSLLLSILPFKHFFFSKMMVVSLFLYVKIDHFQLRIIFKRDFRILAADSSWEIHVKKNDDVFIINAQIKVYALVMNRKV